MKLTPNMLVNPISLAMPLPRDAQAARYVKLRRLQLENHENYKRALHKLFLDCSTGEISSEEFYETLPSYWSFDLDNRLQNNGWERKGKDANFTEIANSFIRIMDTPFERLDAVVAAEISCLAEKKNPARGAFFTEMLCLLYPDSYPVDNSPVKAYLKDIGYKRTRGASEGTKYIDMAKLLRSSVEHALNHPAKTVAELDYVLWLVYGDA